MSKFSIRFKELRNEAQLTQQALADCIKMSKSSVNMYERGEREPGLETLEIIADYFNVDMDYLLGKTDIRNRSKIKVSEPSNISTVLDTDNIYKIPLYNSVSAGFGTRADDYIIDYIATIIKNPEEVADTIAIKVKGDSMYPKIEDGDIIVVRKQDSVDNGSIAVMLLDGEDGLVKKVKYDKDSIELISINPEYKPRVFEGKEVLRLRVVGLVKQVIKML